MLNYRLPKFSDNSNIENNDLVSNAPHKFNGMNYILIGSPIGADISLDGTLKWKAQIDTNVSKNAENENKVEFFAVKVVGPCEQETALIELSVYVYGTSPIRNINYR